MFNPGALTCGVNPGSPVAPDYEGPFTFTGTLDSGTLDVSGELIHDPEAELRALLNGTVSPAGTALGCACRFSELAASANGKLARSNAQQSSDTTDDYCSLATI
jgi:hypothetical protein